MALGVKGLSLFILDLGVHPASRPVGPGRKAAEGRNWPFTLHFKRSLRMYGTIPLLPPKSPWIGVKTEGLLHHLIWSPTREYIKLQIRPTPPTDLRGWPERSASVLRRRGKRGNRRRRWVVGVCRDWGMLRCESSSYAACVACWFNVVVVVCCGANVCVKWCAGL